MVFKLIRMALAEDNDIHGLRQIKGVYDMAVGFNVGFFWYQIGSGDFLHCFFSTVAVNLENSSWGSRFPLIMNKLYQGSLESENVSKALIELNTIEEELRRIPPNKVIWDIDDIKKLPPWGSNISKDITDLSNYFVTSDLGYTFRHPTT